MGADTLGSIYVECLRSWVADRLGGRHHGILHHHATLHLRCARLGSHRASWRHGRRTVRIGALGKRISEREIATGTVLAFATGLGLFFARLSSSASQQMQSILFGSILTITDAQILGFAIFDVILLLVLAIVYRPLLFSSLDEQVARAKGVPITAMNVLFMAIMEGVITVAVPAVGTLLIFALVVTPAATASMITRSPFAAIVVSCLLCLISIWGGLVLSAMFPMPPSFVIVTLSTVFWAVARGISGKRN